MELGIMYSSRRDRSLILSKSMNEYQLELYSNNRLMSSIQHYESNSDISNIEIALLDDQAVSCDSQSGVFLFHGLDVAGKLRECRVDVFKKVSVDFCLFIQFNPSIKSSRTSLLSVLFSFYISESSSYTPLLHPTVFYFTNLTASLVQCCGRSVSDPTAPLELHPRSKST